MTNGQGSPQNVGFYKALSGVSNVVKRLVGGIRVLNIPRLEDLPYWNSPPIQFVYQSTAAAVLGQYTWADAPTLFTPNRPLINNALYLWRDVTLSADVDVNEYNNAIVTRPQFFTFLESDSRGILQREPIEMPTFLQSFGYRYTWQSHQGEDTLFGAFRGVLSQTAALVAKNNITLTCQISAQEIVDTEYINLFKQSYPQSAPASEQALREEMTSGK